VFPVSLTSLLLCILRLIATAPSRELGREYDCTVNAVAPGATNTDAFNALAGDTRDSLEPMLAMTPAASRIGETEEVAYAVAFFCEERARWITGQVLQVNGGTLMA
jgi:NAD(P)-dependent dehydrogenase (short-subunit alcohol dehydrogenase family)